MTLPDLLSHSRTEIEDHSRARAKAFMMRDKLCCRMLGGPLMFCDPDDNVIAPWIGHEGFWECWITMAIGRALQPGWVCYDVGASWGYYCLLMGWAGAGQVVAIEPNWKRGNYARLNMLTSYGQIPFTLSAWGVTDGKHKDCDIVTLPDMASEKGIENRNYPARTFDVICQEQSGGKCDFIKVDIDGGELRFWDGVQKTIEKNPNLTIVMEVNANRYDALAWYAQIQKVFPVLRVVTTDGGVREVSTAELIDLSTEADQMVWLQK